MRGRVREYSKQKRYGFIYTEEGKDIFLSSYEVEERDSKIVVGAIVEFRLGQNEKGIIAKSVTIIERFPNGRFYTLPNGEIINILYLERFGYVTGAHALRQVGIEEKVLYDAGYELEDLDYVFVKCSGNGEYNFFTNGSLIKGCGQTDLNILANDLRTTFLYLQLQGQKF